MKKEFNLSEKINEWWDKVMVISITSVRKEKLDKIHKEFIKIDEELIRKMMLRKISVGEFWDSREKLCGEKLKSQEDKKKL